MKRALLALLFVALPLLMALAWVGCYDNEIFRKSCFQHYLDCQETALGSVKDGYGQSRCQTCWDLCERDGQWPTSTTTGKTCEYWMYRGGPFAVDAGSGK